MKTLIGPEVFSDVEFFRSYSDEVENNTVISKINTYSPNESSKSFIVDLLRDPIHDIDELKRRQEVIKSIINNDNEALKTSFQPISEYEADVLWYLKDNVDETDDIFDNLKKVYFNFFVFEKMGLNKLDTVLLINNIYNIIIYPFFIILSPIMYLILPYVILTRKMKLNISFSNYDKILYNSLLTVLQKNNGYVSKLQFITYFISIGLYFQGLYNTLNISKSTYKTCSFIVNKTKNVLEYLKNCDYLAVELFNCQKDPYISTLLEKIPTLNFGTYLNYYRNIDKSYINGYLNKMNLKFAYYTFAKVQLAYDMCFTEYETDDNFKIIVKDTYHICIKNSVKNDIKLINKGYLITGPNAAGKSTLIKSIILNVLFSQSIGLANATTFSITPFHYINSQINVPDIKGHASLFEAEMLRCKYNLNMLKTLDNKPSFIVLDEVFSSTNIIEGISGAYAILSKLASYTSNCTIVTTHLLYLTKLDNYTKCKMISNKDADGKIIFPFKMKSGISNQYIALELLKGSFDDDIIENALDIKKKLLV